MKILVGSFSSISILGGGVEVQVISTVRAVRKLQSDIEIELFNPWQKYDTANIHLFHLFAAHNGTYHLGRSIKNLGVRLVITPVFYSARSTLKLRLTSKATGILRKFGGIWTEDQFCRELCLMADLVLVNTDAEKRILTGGLGIDAAKIGKVPNGADESFYYANPETFVRRFGMKDFVLYVGHVGLGRKNLLSLLQILKKRRIPAVIIGPVLNTTYARRCLEVIAQSQEIKLLPAVANDSELLRSAYAACDTLILPSLFETPGLAALEAAMAGAKVCITRYGGTEEYFGNYATYLNPRSAASIERALERSLNKPKTNELREHIFRNFTWTRSGEVLLEYYRQLRG